MNLDILKTTGVHIVCNIPYDPSSKLLFNEVLKDAANRNELTIFICQIMPNVIPNKFTHFYATEILRIDDIRSFVMTERQHIKYPSMVRVFLPSIRDIELPDELMFTQMPLDHKLTYIMGELSILSIVHKLSIVVGVQLHRQHITKVKSLSTSIIPITEAIGNIATSVSIICKRNNTHELTVFKSVHGSLSEELSNPYYIAQNRKTPTTTLAYNPDKFVKQYAELHNLDPITAWVQLEATECGITDEEMPRLLKLFNGYINQQMTVEQSIKASLEEIILHIPKTTELPAEPLEHRLIRNLIEKLLQLSEHDNMNYNNLQLINNDIATVKLRYLKDAPEGDAQKELFNLGLPTMEFKEAFDTLVNRYNNSLTAIGH